MSDSRPLLAITQGDPAGVGPEVIVGAWADPAWRASGSAFVIGHPEILRSAARLLSSSVQIEEIADPVDASEEPGIMSVLPAGDDNVLQLTPGRIDPRGGQAAYDALIVAAELAQQGRIAGLVTAPLSKAALWAAGHHYPGHTELLGELCGAHHVAMMLYLPSSDLVAGEAGLGVVHVTLHMALREMFDHLTEERIVTRCKLAREIMQRLGRPDPRIGVAALNPHAGEEGLFGDEERTIIEPAVRRASAEGVHVAGPLPCDTLMVRARDGEFDAVVAMYHDQGHIALKLLGMHRAVNVTLGLPIVRTSVAHGTAFDRAWRGVCDPGGMVAALQVAAQLVRNTP